ncbi:MAG: hypothetical protein ACI8VE_002820, partial [Natrialbaceae archaeon]
MIGPVGDLPDVQFHLDGQLHRLCHHVGVVMQSLVPQDGAVSPHDQPRPSLEGVFGLEHAVPGSFGVDSDVLQVGGFGRLDGVTHADEREPAESGKHD